MSQNQIRSRGFWDKLVHQSRLSWRLLWDQRVPVWAKLVPFLAFLYILSPIDFLPDWFLGIGQLDDLGVLLVGLRLFIALIPEEIMLQHLDAMGFGAGKWRVVEQEPPVIEAEYEVRDE